MGAGHCCRLYFGKLAKGSQHQVGGRGSRIGFEATNHYMYYPLDMVEKVVNCDYVLNKWLPSQAKADK